MLFISGFWFPILICQLIKNGNQKGEINNIHRFDSYQLYYFQKTQHKNVQNF